MYLTLYIPLLVTLRVVSQFLFANLKGMYEIARKHDVIPVIMDSARFAENANFVQQREEAYKDRTIEQITHESYRYADGLADKPPKKMLHGANGGF